MYQIVQAPDSILRTPVKPVKLPTAKLKKILEEMRATLLAQVDPEGVGLAANQVGLPYQLFLARFDTKDLPAGRQENNPVHVFINPEIIAHSEELQPENKDEEEKAPLEGCLSLPKYYGIVKRWKWVKVRYQTLRHSGEPKATPESLNDSDAGLGQHDSLVEKTEKVNDFPATVIQHEMDHLHGRIFVERILEQNGQLYKSTGKNKRGKDVWEEVEI